MVVPGLAGRKRAVKKEKEEGKDGKEKKDDDAEGLKEAYDDLLKAVKALS